MSSLKGKNSTESIPWNPIPMIPGVRWGGEGLKLVETGGNCCSIKSTPLKPIKMKLVENCPLTSTDGNTRTVEIRNPTRNKLLNSLQLIFFFKAGDKFYK